MAVSKKTFGKSSREVPSASEKAPKWYPAEDDSKPKTVRKSIRAWSPRESLKPGTVLILLAGRFRSKRVVLLKTLEQGVLLVTGPFKINGVPLRRVNARYVIATTTTVNLDGLDQSKIDEISKAEYFARDKVKEQTSEQAFFKQGEKPEVQKLTPAPAHMWSERQLTAKQKKEISATRAADQKAVDKVLLANIKNVEFLPSYLASSFSLRNGDKPHEMKW